MFSLGPSVSSSSFVPPGTSFPSLHPAPSTSLASSVVPGDPHSSVGVLTGPGFSSALGGSGSAASRTDVDVVPGTSSVSYSFADPLHFRDGDKSSDKGDKESPALGKADFSKAFREVVSLITSFFPAAKPSDSSSIDLSLWFNDFGMERCRDPRVFLSLFDKLAPVKRDIDEKFCKAADEKKKATNALPNWGRCLSLGGLARFL